MTARINAAHIHRILLLALLPAFLVSCGVSVGEAPAGNDGPMGDTDILYLTSGGNTQSTGIIRELSLEYVADHPSVNFKHESLGSSDLSRKLQLLAASNDLPVLFSYPSGKPLLDFIRSDAVLDIGQTFRELGIYDTLNPAAVELLQSHVDGKGLYALPLEMNIEGFWYNKKIFAELGLREPSTWQEMQEQARILAENGIQPFAVAGKEKWPITRLINAYIIRYYGADAMKLLDQGELRLTDPGFIAAAETVQQMAQNGYFGPSAVKVDFRQATNAFLDGEAAMFYSGSWSLRDFNNPDRNRIGADQIGFFSIPLVDGGKGTADEYPINAGLTVSFSREAYTPAIGEWIKAVFSQYGDEAMRSQHMITGFKVRHMPAAIPPLTRMVMDKIGQVKKGALWFEARFGTSQQLAAWEQAQLLIMNSDYTPFQYMSDLQAVLHREP